MPYALRTYQCVTCGEPCRRRAARGAEVRCISCSIQRSVINVYQQRSKSGEFYDRWAAGIKRAADEAVVLSAIGNEINSIGLSNKRPRSTSTPLPYGSVTYGAVAEHIS